MKDGKFPKYQKCDASSLILTRFGKLEPGNLFFMEQFKYEMLMIVTNERKEVSYDRNCTAVVALDKSYCGLSFWLPDDEEVYVVEDSNVVLRAYYLL
jgi:hypothetical protein